MAILARVSVFFAEYALPQRCKQGTDIRGSLTADKARRIGQRQQRLAIVQAGAHNSREHRRDAAVLDGILSAVDLETHVTGVYRSARRKDAHLGRLATGARDGFSVGAHHRRPDRERAEITGAARAKLVTEREPDVPARAHENFG